MNIIKSCQKAFAVFDRPAEIERRINLPEPEVTEVSGSISESAKATEVSAPISGSPDTRTVTAIRDIPAKMPHGTLTIPKGQKFLLHQENGKISGERGTIQFPVSKDDFE